jgi:hypothetical protein
VIFPIRFPRREEDGTYTPSSTVFGRLTYIATHVSEALDLLIQQFKEKPLIAGLVTALVTEVQELEDAAWEVLLATDLDNARNAQLTGLGTLVGEPRRGRSDIAYRPAIRVRILINRCNGKHPEILKILTLFLGATDGDGTIELVDAAPAAMALNVFRLPESPSDLRVITRSIKPGGVNLDGRYATHATRMYRFGWTSPITGVTGANNGDGWTDNSVGGQQAGRI